MPQVVPGARPSASRQAAATVHGCPARPEGAEGRLGTLLAPRGEFWGLGRRWWRRLLQSAI